MWYVLHTEIEGVNSSMLCMECVNNKVSHIIGIPLFNECYTAKGVLDNNARNGGNSQVTTGLISSSCPLLGSVRSKLSSPALHKSRDHMDQPFTLASAKNQDLSCELM